jgi:hypothetical protein
LGNIFVDLAEFKPNLRVANKQCRYFLAGVDCLSQKMCCIPLANKTQVSWERGVRQMIEKEFPVVTTIITDRDTAVAGLAFQNKIKSEFGVSWFHLRTRSKAYKAERAIRFLKERLSTALSFNEKGDNNWLQHVRPILDDYNSRNVRGTDMKRGEIGKRNVKLLLEKLYGAKDYSPIFNTSVASVFTPRMRRLLKFKLAVGQKVLLATSSNYNFKSGAFAKKSVEGAYGKKVYEIERQLLKSNASHHYNMVYKLKGMEGIFYPSELIPASFAASTAPEELEREASRDEAETRRRAKAKKKKKTERQ